MTIFRSKLDFGFHALAALGVFGFLACGAVNLAAQSRLLGHSEYNQASAERPIAVELKSQTFFVERAYGNRLNLTDKLLLPFWMVGAIGVAGANRSKILQRLKGRK